MNYLIHPFDNNDNSLFLIKRRKSNDNNKIMQVVSLESEAGNKFSDVYYYFMRCPNIKST